MQSWRERDDVNEETARMVRDTLNATKLHLVGSRLRKINVKGDVGYFFIDLYSFLLLSTDDRRSSIAVITSETSTAPNEPPKTDATSVSSSTTSNDTISIAGRKSSPV